MGILYMFVPGLNISFMRKKKVNRNKCDFVLPYFIENGICLIREARDEAVLFLGCGLTHMNLEKPKRPTFWNRGGSA